MECNRFKTNLPGFSANELTNAERTWCAAHVEICPDCARLLEAEQDLIHRVRESCLGDAHASIGFSTRVHAALTAERDRTARATKTTWWRWLAPLGLAVALLIGFYSWRQSFQPGLSVYQAAVNDHIYDVVERLKQPAGQKTPAEINAFALGVSGMENLVSRISPAGFQLVHVRACRLDGIVYGHFIYEKDGRHISIYVRPNKGALSGPILETVGGVPLHGCSISQLQSVGLQTARLTFVVVADPVIADARTIARALATSFT